LFPSIEAALEKIQKEGEVLKGRLIKKQVKGSYLLLHEW